MRHQFVRALEVVVCCRVRIQSTVPQRRPFQKLQEHKRPASSNPQCCWQHHRPQHDYCRYLQGTSRNHRMNPHHSAADIVQQTVQWRGSGQFLYRRGRRSSLHGCMLCSCSHLARQELWALVSDQNCSRYSQLHSAWFARQADSTLEAA